MVQINWDDIGKCYEGKYLRFEETPFGFFSFSNKEGDDLGYIELIKVGRWSHWCLFLNDKCYLSPGCNDEVREMQRMLGSKSYKEWSEKHKNTQEVKDGKI